MRWRPKCLHSLSFDKLRTGGRAVLYLNYGFVFALCERKNKNIELGSAMLPQAKIDYRGQSHNSRYSTIVPGNWIEYNAIASRINDC